MKAAPWLVGAIALSPLLMIAPIVIALSGSASAQCKSDQGDSPVQVASLTRLAQQILAGQNGDVSVPGLDDPAKQVPHATTIVAVGVALKIPARGQVTALATAMQESRLINLPYGDRDSIGLFQQRPSMGWGTVAQIMDPVYSATKFYTTLKGVHGWEQMTIGQAAQAVQQSAFPDLYDQWVPIATALQQAITATLPGGEASAANPDTTQSADPSRTPQPTPSAEAGIRSVPTTAKPVAPAPQRAITDVAPAANAVTVSPPADRGSDAGAPTASSSRVPPPTPSGTAGVLATSTTVPSGPGEPSQPTAPPSPSSSFDPGATVPPVAPVTGAGLAGCRADGTGAAGGDGSGFGTIPAGALPDGYEIPADASPIVQTAIRWALGQLGTPYQWGGTCADPRGPDPIGRCDCSSLMQRAYAAAGVAITRTTYTQVAEGVPVTPAELRPGDLVFTRGTAAVPEHVGMVIGSGLIVNAPRTGDVVRIATLAAWRPRILAARRVTT